MTVAQFPPMAAVQMDWNGYQIWSLVAAATIMIIVMVAVVALVGIANPVLGFVCGENAGCTILALTGWDACFMHYFTMLPHMFSVPYHG